MKCPRWSVVADEVHKTWWLAICSDFVDECCDPKADSSADRKPVCNSLTTGLIWPWRHAPVTTFPGRFSTHSTSQGLTQTCRLETHCNSSVIANNGTGNSICSRMVDGPWCLSKTSYVNVWVLAAVSRALVECQWCVDCDAESLDVIRQNYRCTSNNNWGGTLERLNTTTNAEHICLWLVGLKRQRVP